MKTISQKQLKEVLEYNPNTGVFIWKKRISIRITVGKVAGVIAKKGSYERILIGVYGHRYKAHHLAWLYMYGSFPTDLIDHINHDATDNRIVNLRETTHKNNLRNQRVRESNTSGCMGVQKRVLKTKTSWRVGIMVDGKNINLGSFGTFDEAVKARKEGVIKYGFHPNHGVDL